MRLFKRFVIGSRANNNNNSSNNTNNNLFDDDIPDEVTIEGSLLDLTNDWNGEICLKPFQNKRFERDLIRMMKYIQLTIIDNTNNNNNVKEFAFKKYVNHLENQENNNQNGNSNGNFSKALLVDILNGISFFLKTQQEEKEKELISFEKFNKLYDLDSLQESTLKSTFIQLIEILSNNNHNNNDEENNNQQEFNEEEMNKEENNNEHFNCILKLLTGVSQSIAVSTLTVIAEAITSTKRNNQLIIKDARGSWSIQFRKFINNNTTNYSNNNTNNNNSDNDTKKISILHQRTETVMKITEETLLIPMLDFTWQVEIEFNNLEINQIQSVTIRLLSMNWKNNENTLNLTEKEKQSLESYCRNLFTNKLVTNYSKSNNNNEKNKVRVIINDHVISSGSSGGDNGISDKPLIEIKLLNFEPTKLLSPTLPMNGSMSARSNTSSTSSPRNTTPRNVTPRNTIMVNNGSNGGGSNCSTPTTTSTTSDNIISETTEVSA
ncbi:hypothetical protein ABK040_002455 [Willaertia magna]